MHLHLEGNYRSHYRVVLPHFKLQVLDSRRKAKDFFVYKNIAKGCPCSTVTSDMIVSCPKKCLNDQNKPNMHIISVVILLHEKFLQFDWLRAVTSISA